MRIVIDFDNIATPEYREVYEEQPFLYNIHQPHYCADILVAVPHLPRKGDSIYLPGFVAAWPSLERDYGFISYSYIDEVIFYGDAIVLSLSESLL